MINVNQFSKVPKKEDAENKKKDAESGKNKSGVYTYPIEEPPSYILIEGATWNGKPTYEKVYILS